VAPGAKVGPGTPGFSHIDPEIWMVNLPFSGSKRIKHPKQQRSLAVQAHWRSLHVNTVMHNVKWMYPCSFKEFQAHRQPEKHGSYQIDILNTFDKLIQIVESRGTRF
jgi:iron only hydrogenase large subunit-like protein